MIERRSGEIDGFGTGHPEVNELIGYVRGELSQRGAASVRMHAAECMDCGDQLAALILLREERLYTGGTAAPQATVTRFPVPATVRVRRRWPASAAAALLIPALAWFGWSARVAEHQPLVEQGRPPSIGFDTVAGDVDRVMAVVDGLGMRFNDAAQVAADGAVTDDVLIAVALRAMSSGDLTAARTLLEPFGERWERAGTALFGYVLFLLEDPAAYQVLEMYAADHPTQAWEAEAETPEDLAFFFVARLRYATGDQAGAREAVGWIHPRTETGTAAVAWLQDKLGDTASAAAPDLQR